ncbi:MAG: amino acid ABC transporter substrate-binding protein [Phaeodactylibacter sp.]|nr:amino acid ABC transporter substrate-binding protein [Phaeodactylibacter sp.]MCB9301039.1 amino acid ABC transporter substrate-binding protein [Lewinellaceae bacterium]
MISAPSRQLLLNGNKLLAICLALLLMPSCSLFKKAQVDEKKDKTGAELDPIPGKKVYDPETGTLVVVEQTPVESMDTIRWRSISTDSLPPIRSEAAAFAQEQDANTPELTGRGDFGSEFYTSYNVALMLPFLTDRFNAASSELPENSSWALNFYGGMRMGMDQLNEEGVKLNVTVMDSKANSGDVARLLAGRSELLDAHLIIGPYRKENVELVANFAKRNNITFVSPHSASSDISVDNPNYIQVSPTLESHCVAITQHARSHYNRKKIVLVAREKDAEKARFTYFQEENYRIQGVRNDSVKLKEYVVDEKSENYQNINLAPYMRTGDTTVFLVPSFSSETFVYALLSHLKAVKPVDSYVVVYGLPQWMRYERIDFELYKSLNVHVSSDTYIDPYDEDIQFFRRRFYDRYGVIPGDEAFIGYDVALYFGRMIRKYGTKFQYALEREPEQMLHTRFDFERVSPPQAAGRENTRIERFENKFVNILEFRDYFFQPSN